MGRMYSVQFENVAVTAAQDFFEITPADDKPIVLHSAFITQNSEIGDAQEEMLRLSIIRGYTSSGSGGTAPTPASLDPAGAAAGFTAEVNNTTIANTGTTVTLHSETFNVRTGWIYVPTPECRIKASQANTTIVIRLLANPTDSISMSGTLYVEEM